MKAETSPALDINGTVARGDFRLPVELSVAPGEVLALIGRNGSGKTSTLRTIAGLDSLAAGAITIRGTTVDSRGTSDTGRFVPAQERRVGMVFQDHVLFDHLSALENVAFGLRARGMGRGPAREQARGWLSDVGLGDLADRRPDQLSGGQSARVSLARALATQPTVMLLDEPLAAIDASAKPALRGLLRRTLTGFGGASIIVTHDLIDAMVLADRVAVIDQGIIAQIDTPAEITRHPRTPYLAELLDINLFSGLGRGGKLSIGHSTVTAPTELEGRTLITLPPHAVTITAAKPEGAGRSTFAARVVGVQETGISLRIRLSPVNPDAGLACVAAVDLARSAVDPTGTDAATEASGPAIGEIAELGALVWATVDESALHAYPF